MSIVEQTINYFLVLSIQSEVAMALGYCASSAVVVISRFWLQNCSHDYICIKETVTAKTNLKILFCSKRLFIYMHKCSGVGWAGADARNNRLKVASEA